jgi:hypothetical protein
MSQEILNAIGQHLGGSEIVHGPALARLRKQVPAAWRLWDGSSPRAKWAVFVLSGHVLSSVDEQSIRKAILNRIRVLLVAQQYEDLAAAAPIYREVGPYVLYPIAGRLTLIPPPTLKPTATSPVAASSRVPLDMLTAVAALAELPTELAGSLSALANKYSEALNCNKCDDNWEEKTLLSFAKNVLTQMGLNPTHIKATAMIRTLERDEMGASRDHFFHSFQNYFLGLTAIAQLKREFLSFRTRGTVNWNVEPADVWFLTALWHDVGYAGQKYSNLYAGAFGHQEDEEQAEIKIEAIQRLLDRPQAKTGVRTIASLMDRLLRPTNSTTGWMPPGDRTLLNEHAKQLESAIHRNIRKSHGALGAIRLFVDYMDDIDQTDPNRQDILKQTVLLACVSMPFHDFWFRLHVREECRACRMPVGALPFAALLAFIDSIQDDRRNLEAVKEAVLILKKLLITPPRTVAADINIDALTGQQLLDKIMEGRDVLAALDQRNNTLSFKYPSWVFA